MTMIGMIQMKKLNNKGFAVTAILYSLLILIILLMFLIIILLSTRRVNLNRAIRDANREIDEREYSYMEICTINPYNIDKEQTKCGYGATGRVRAVKVYKGIYMLEVWGAQGGGLLTSAFNLQGGKGSYATGIITLNADETYMYINVGVRGTGFKSTPGSMEGYATTPGPMAGGGFNFGGMGYVAPGNADLYATGRGGGATDIRINKNNSASRVIVAGGGGAAGGYSNGQRFAGGDGGAAEGLPGGLQCGGNNHIALGGTQTKGGRYTFGDSGSVCGGSFEHPSTLMGICFEQADFNKGGGYISGAVDARCSGNLGIAGGGGGWYGGGAGISGSAGGGSSFVFTNVAAVQNLKYTDGRNVNYELGSEYLLKSARTVAGNATMPAVNGGNQTGQLNSGYARITACKVTVANDEGVNYTWVNPGCPGFNDMIDLASGCRNFATPATAPAHCRGTVASTGQLWFRYLEV